MIRQKYYLRLCKPWMFQKQKQNNTKPLGQQADKRTTSVRWTQVIAGMPYVERGWSHKCRIYASGDHMIACIKPQVIARLPAAYGRYFCDHLRSTEDISRINCVHYADVVRLVAISAISVVKSLTSVTKNTARTTRVICVHLRKLIANLRNLSQP